MLLYSGQISLLDLIYLVYLLKKSSTLALDLKTTLECETSNQTDRPQGNLPDA